LIPYERWPAALAVLFDGLDGRVAVADVWMAIGLPPTGTGRHHYAIRVKAIMEGLGWASGTELHVGPRMIRCYVKGPPPRLTIYVHLDDPVRRSHRATHSVSPTRDAPSHRTRPLGPSAHRVPPR
jgi:hypothetical protein